jgi:GT2 family glycosyltransferase
MDECMRALATQSLAPGDFEAIFVDAVGARDWQPIFDEFISTRNDLNFSYHKIAKGGRAKAVNFGVRNTSADIVIFLADDFIPSTSLVEAHWRFHQDNPEIHAVGIGGGVFSEEIRSEEFCRWLEDTGELFGVSFTNATDNFPSNYFYLGNSSIKREFLNSAGSFDESFPFPAWDDYEMGLRLAALGMQSKYVPEALAIHHHQVDLSARRAQMQWAGISAALFELEHGQNPCRDRCKIHWGRHRLRGLRKMLQYRLTGKPRHQHQSWRSMLDAEFVRAYARAKAALTVDA